MIGAQSRMASHFPQRPADTFGEVGFLTSGFAEWSAQHVRNFADQYAFCLSLNRQFQRWVFSLEVHEFNEQGELDPQPLMLTCLAARALSHFQGILILAQRGMTPEGRIIARSLLEVSFRFAAIAKNPALARDYILEDNTLRKKLIDKLEKLSPDGRASITDAERDAARAAIADALDGYGGKTHTVEWYAEKAGMRDFYNSAYALLSITVHAHARDLQQYVETDERGKITSLIFRPTEEGVSTLLLTAQECLLVILEQAQGVFPRAGFEDEVKQLRERSLALNQSLADRPKAHA